MKDEITVFDFKPEHILEMDMRDVERVGFRDSKNFLDRVEYLDEKSEGAITLRYGEEILCCAGFWTIWEGVGECWVIPSKTIYKAPKTYVRRIKTYLDNIMLITKFHRMQSTALSDEVHEAWMKFLGFEKEGTMKKFTYDKKDYCMWGRVA